MLPMLPLLTTPSFSAGMFTGLGFANLHAVRLGFWLKRPIDIMPRSPVVLLVPDANIIGPPRRLHEQHDAMISDGNILRPRLPLVRVPGMFSSTALTFSMVRGLFWLSTW
jgi:hypothetical protein